MLWVVEVWGHVYQWPRHLQIHYYLKKCELILLDDYDLKFDEAVLLDVEEENGLGTTDGSKRKR